MRAHAVWCAHQRRLRLKFVLSFWCQYRWQYKRKRLLAPCLLIGGMCPCWRGRVLADHVGWRHVIVCRNMSSLIGDYTEIMIIPRVEHSDVEFWVRSVTSHVRDLCVTSSLTVRSWLLIVTGAMSKHTDRCALIAHFTKMYSISAVKICRTWMTYDVLSFLWEKRQPNRGSRVTVDLFTDRMLLHQSTSDASLEIDFYLLSMPFYDSCTMTSCSGNSTPQKHSRCCSHDYCTESVPSMVEYMYTAPLSRHGRVDNGQYLHSPYWSWRQRTLYT